MEVFCQNNCFNAVVSYCSCLSTQRTYLVYECPQYYNAPYLEEGYCNAEQKRLAITLITTDEWFSPVLTEKEKSQLKPVNITTVPPGPQPVKIPEIEPNNGENRR